MARLMGMVTEMHLRTSEGGGVRFNYRGLHRYLITLPSAAPGVCLSGKETVFAILAVLREACRTHQFDLYAYCFLADRLVIIVRGKSEDSDMKKFLAEFRAASATALPGRLWARKYQERVLRRLENTRTVADGVFQLPVKAGLAPAPAAYPYQGSFVLPPAGDPPPPTRRPPNRRAPHRFSRGSKKKGGGR